MPYGAMLCHKMNDQVFHPRIYTSGSRFFSWFFRLPFLLGQFLFVFTFANDIYQNGRPSRPLHEPAKKRVDFVFFWKQNCQSTKNFETINWQCLFSFKLSHIYTLTIYSIHVLLQKGEKKQSFVLPASCFAKNKFRIAMNEIAMAS